MRHLAIWLFGAVCLAGAVVDRLAVTVGSTVITDLQIDEEIRVTALLNNQPIKRDLESRRSAADRLVEQMLIHHETQLSRYPLPSAAEVNAYYSKVADILGGPELLKDMFAKYDVSAATLVAHLTAQLQTLRFIEFRFAPDISVSDGEIDSSYRRQIGSRRATDQPLDAAEHSRISQMLLAERTDAALNSWLAENRKQVNIVYIDSTLQ